MNAESVQVFAAPVEGNVEGVVEFGEAHFAGDQQASPDQWAHTA